MRHHSKVQFPTEAVDAFFNLFEPTILLAEKLISARTNAQEIVLLMCARLDALASCTSREDQPNRESFIRLLVNYGGYRNLMESVSVGDLYYELGYHRWLAEGMIPRPGRLVRFSRLNDPILELLDRSNVPLTVDAVQSLLTRLMRVMSDHFRCRPGQPLRKPMTGKPKTIAEKIVVEFKHSKDVELRESICAAIEPFLRKKTVAALMYDNFRNPAVHGLKVELDEANFFNGQSPYWQSLYSDYYPPFMFVKFPGPFLLDLLRNCMRTLKEQMLSKRKLPPDVHFHAFNPDIVENIQFLDCELLPKPYNLKFQRR
ncbi:MAG TPA: hypothetical protein VHX63_02620 [Acidobacteriaceae bacterium]|jgi:hypothetical protein|nr:hypothetical protein [Acidobacteriaceae bacterium]